MRCRLPFETRSTPKAPPDSYVCALEENQVETPWAPRGWRGCLDHWQGIEVWPDCRVQVEVDHTLMPLSEFKDTYWK
jgi:hypothetical protein